MTSQSPRPISIEDPLKVVPNIFELIRLAANRARDLANGAKPVVDNSSNHLHTVLALKEIAAGHTTFEDDTNA